MKTTFKFAGLSALLFGQSLCLLAQTAWHNPAADSLLPIQGRAWNAETGKAYQRLPQRAEQLVRKPVWDLSLQTAGLYVKFYTNAPQIQVSGYGGILDAPHAGNRCQRSRPLHDGLQRAAILVRGQLSVR